MQKKTTKQFDTATYLNMLSELIEQGKGVAIVVSGSSMAPFIRSNKDWVYLEKIDSQIKKGDIALFKRKNGDFILHRVCKIENNSYYFSGDAQAFLEGPVSRDSIVAVVTKYKRRKSWKKTTTLRYMFYSKVWIHFGCMKTILVNINFKIKRIIMKLYKFICSIFKRKTPET